MPNGMRSGRRGDIPMAKTPMTLEEQRRAHAKAQQRYAATPKGKVTGKRARDVYKRTPKGIEARCRNTQIQNERRQRVSAQNLDHNNEARRIKAIHDGDPWYGHLLSDGTIDVRRL